MEILHLDAAIIVLNKPAGLPVQPDGWDAEAPYLIKLLEAEHGRVWVVHRLDKVTSGALVLARNAEAHRALSLQFEHREARKVYHALVTAAPEWNEFTASLSLRSNVGHRHRTVVDPRTGKRASTTFTVLERFRAHALLEARPLTGRTHQVRAHAAALRCPLLGDTLYGAPATDLIARPALHASSLTFTHPESNSEVTYVAPHPEDFERALAALRAGRGQLENKAAQG